MKCWTWEPDKLVEAYDALDEEYRRTRERLRKAERYARRWKDLARRFRHADAVLEGVVDDSDYYHTSVAGTTAQSIIAQYDGKRVRVEVHVLDADPVWEVDGHRVDLGMNDDGHWIARVPGKMAIGFTREQAVERLRGQ